jgi:uncharacterized protein YrrD
MRAGLDIVGLTVRDESGRRTGTVSDVVFDDASRHVIGVTVRRGRFRRQHEFIAIQYVRSIGRESLVADTGRACPASDGRENALQGKLVVSRTGQSLGRIKDVYIDETTGEVKAYQIASDAPAGTDRQGLLILADSRPIIGDVMVVTDPRVTGRADDYPGLA